MKTILFLSLGFFAYLSTFSQMMYPGDVTVTGPEETVFDYSTDNCSGQMSVDGAPQIFRDAAGNIQLLNMHTTTFRMVGPDFDNLSIDCSTPVFDSDDDPDPANFNYKEWLGSTWTDDGETIYGLVHSEWHAYDFSGQCLSSDVMKCWYNGITLVSSADTGRTFTHATAPNHLVASVPYEYNATYQSRQGAFGPGAIVQNPHDGYYYCPFYTEENINGTSSYLQQGGTCVMRTDDLSDPTSWRVWDGEGYNTECVNPYTDTFEIEDHLLHPIGIGKQVSGLTFNTYFDMWMMISPSTKYNLNEDRNIRGFYYQLSDDLINWTGPKLLMEMNFPESSPYNNGDLDQYGMYPVVIDHDDSSRNFMYTDQDCYLYYTVWNTYPGETSGSPNRDLRRVPITFSKNYVEEFTINGKGNQYDAAPGDGICSTESGKCSLYAAIQESNSRLPRYEDSLLTVNFNVSGPNFSLQDPPFTMTYPMYFDGYTQSGSSENTTGITEGMDTDLGIQFNFNGNPALYFTGGNSGIRGVAITDHSGPAISFADKGGNSVDGCFLGTATDGMSNEAESTGGSGVAISNCDNNRVGGSELGQHNIIIGGVSLNNAHNNLIQGNYIDLSADGETSLQNVGSNGIQLVQSNNNTIGGTNEEARNVLSGGYNRAITLEDDICIDNEIVNNYIGTNAEATASIGSYNAGIALLNGANNNTIGSPDAGNILGASSCGVAYIVFEDGASDNTVQANAVGTNFDEDVNLKADDGAGMASIFMTQDVANNMIGGENEGEGNILCNGAMNGILTYGSTGYGNSFLRNSIYNNSNMGIDLSFDNWALENDLYDEDDGPNENQNHPEIETVLVTETQVIIMGFLNSVPDENYRLEFFANDECSESNYGEGKYFIGSVDVLTNAEAVGEFDVTFDYVASESQFFSGTATNANGSTSEFSECKQSSSPEPEITITPDSIDEQVALGQNGETVITIANDGIQDLVWSLTFGDTWLSTSNTGGTITSGESIDVTIDIASEDFIEGEYSSEVIVISNDSDELNTVIELNLTMNSEPMISYPNTSVSVTQEQNTNLTHSFEISNDGTGTLSWMLTTPIEDNSWLVPMMPNTGTLEEGESTFVQYVINTNSLTPGEYSSDLVINSNASNESFVLIPLNLEVTEDSGGGDAVTLNIIVDQFDYCQGETKHLQIQVTGVVQNGNNYKVQLSDENGDFSSPTIIGELSSNALNSMIEVVFPENISDGNGFKLRLTASMPATIGQENPNDITLQPWQELTLPTVSAQCVSNSPVDLSSSSPAGGSWIGEGIDGDNFDPTIAGIGVHDIIYQYTSPENCLFEEIIAIEVIDSPEVSIEPVGSYCDNGEDEVLSASPQGGTWEGEGMDGNVFSPIVAGEGEFEVTYTFNAGEGCVGEASTTIIVHASPEVSIIDQEAICSNIGLIELYGAYPEGGEYWGVNIDNGLFNSDDATETVYDVNYTYTSNLGCEGNAVAEIPVMLAAEISVDEPGLICDNHEDIVLSIFPENHTTQGFGMVGDSFSPQTAGFGEHEITISTIDENSCETIEVMTLIVEESPTVSLDEFAAMCSNQDVFVLEGGLPLGGDYYLNNTVTVVVDPSLMATGTYEIDYRFESTNGCVNKDSQTLTIYPAQETPTISFTNSILHSSSSESNQWYLDNELIEEATEQDYTPILNGDYTVMLTDEYCPSEASNIINVNVSSTSLIESSDFQVYPNPFRNEIVIQSDTPWEEDDEIRIFKDNGQLVMSMRVSDMTSQEGRLIINEGIEELASGTYILHLLKQQDAVQIVMQKE